MKKRFPSKHPIVRGVKTFPDGREVCTTLSAWKRRKLEVMERDKGMCRICPLLNLESHAVREQDWTADHITKRGAGGATRDDRLENLRLACNWGHAEAHDRNIHRKRPTT